MPELPDLQVIAQNLKKMYVNSRLENIYLSDKAKTNVDITVYNKVLIGKRIETIFRFGKEIGITFENNHSLYLHLMREGELFKSDVGVKNIILMRRIFLVL